MKQCFKCKKSKPLSNFYVHKRMADGHLNKCKECTKQDSRSNRASKIEYYREYDKHRFHTEKRQMCIEKYKTRPWFKKSIRASIVNYRKQNREKYLAHSKVNYAVRVGKLKKLPCMICGNKKVHAHHTDYLKPLVVQWLCAVHHHEAHKK